MDTFEFAGFTFPRRIPRLLLRKPMGKRLDRAYYAAPKPGADGCSFYLDSDFMPGLRWAWCDEVDGIGHRIQHAGWFCDDFQDQTIRGFVMRLPRGRGFLAGWSMGEGMTSFVSYSVWGDELDAAYEADRMAERAAETEREYQARENARMRAQDLRDALCRLREERRELVREMKQARRACAALEPNLVSVCNALRRRLNELRQDSEAAFKERQRRSNYHGNAEIPGRCGRSAGRQRRDCVARSMAGRSLAGEDRELSNQFRRATAHRVCDRRSRYVVLNTGGVPGPGLPGQGVPHLRGW